MRRSLALFAILALLAAVAVAGPASGADEQATQSARTIKVTDNKFRSGGLRIRRGAVSVPKNANIAFIWSDTGNEHNVRRSGSKGDRLTSRTTDKAGYRYDHRFRATTSVLCRIHPTEMKLKVNVR